MRGGPTDSGCHRQTDSGLLLAEACAISTVSQDALVRRAGCLPCAWNEQQAVAAVRVIPRRYGRAAKAGHVGAMYNVARLKLVYEKDYAAAGTYVSEHSRLLE